MKRAARGLWVVIACVGIAGCRDVGLPDRNLPLEEAVNRQFGYPVYQPAPANVPVAAAGRHWIRSLTVEAIPGRLLVQVANAEGTLLYARRGEQAPFAILYSPVSADRWSPWQRLN